MKKNDFLSPAPRDYKWPQCPEADAFIRQHLVAFLQGHAFARRLSERMQDETSTEFQVWVDHLILPKTVTNETALLKLGYVKESTEIYWHPSADLPRIIL